MSYARTSPTAAAVRADALDLANAPDDVLRTAQATCYRRHADAAARAATTPRSDTLDYAARAWLTAGNCIGSTLDARAAGIVRPGDVTRMVTVTVEAMTLARFHDPRPTRRPVAA